MRVAVVGSRNFSNLSLVFYFVSKLPQGTIIVSGGARGVDRSAEEAAAQNLLKTQVFLPDWDTHGKRAGFLRNQQIIDNSDCVVAFWDGESRGTLDSINKAKKLNKSTFVVTPDNLSGMYKAVEHILFQGG